MLPNFQSSKPKPMTDALLSLPSDQLLALARVALASFGLLAIVYDPTVPPDGPAVAVLFGYLVYGVAWGGFAQGRAPSEAARVATHLVDIAAAGLMMHFTDGPTGPFFVFFTFVLFAGTLRWNGRGAVSTAAALLAVFILLGVVDELQGHLDQHDPTLMTMRVVYLAVAAAMFGYVGAYRARSRERLELLAIWPPEQTRGTDAPDLDQSLAHAAQVTRAKRILVTWEETDEPFVCQLEWANGRSRLDRKPPGGQCLEPISALTAPLRSRHFQGRLSLIEAERVSEEATSLAEIAAWRIGSELEHHRLRRHLAESSALRERIRVARDIHDGTLQALTAAGLQLKAVAQQVPEAIASQLDEVRLSLAHQQRQLRTFVNDILKTPTAESERVSLREALLETIREVERQWALKVEQRIDLTDALVERGLAHELSHLVSEAAANAARHGNARRFYVGIQQSPDGLVLRIQNDGSGCAPACEATPENGAAALQGSSSIRQRAAALGGTVDLPKVAEGYEIEIRIPRP